MKVLKKLMKPFRGKIKTQEEYEERFRTFSALMDKGEDLTEDESDYMDLLGTLLEDYEHTRHPELDADVLQSVTPIDAIRWAMDRHGLLQKDLSPYIGSPQLVSAIMNGNRTLSKSMIVRLHDGLGIPYEQLLRMPENPRYRKVAMF